jgi:hypothetical protein
VIRESNIDPVSHVFDETAEDEARRRETRRRARRAVASRAVDADDCRLLLDSLGLLDGVR